jgi:putative transposase
MARPLRIDMPDGQYHVTSRGLERRAIVHDDTDRQMWVRLLDRVARRRQWRVLAWTLMENHFHLYVRTPQADLSAGMHDLNSGYVSVFNRRHDRAGPLFQGRFKAILVEQEQHDWELSRYIHLNPVRAALAPRPELYAWSSCSAYFNERLAPEWLAWQDVLTQHGRTIRAARRAYMRFLMEGTVTPPPSPLSGVHASILLGSPGFIERMKTWLEDRLPDHTIPMPRELRHEPSIPSIVEAVANILGETRDIVMNPATSNHLPRSVAFCLCRRLTRMTYNEIGHSFGDVQGNAVVQCLHRLSIRLAKDSTLNAQVQACENQLTLTARKK